MVGIGSLGGVSRTGAIYEIRQATEVRRTERSTEERTEISSRREARLAESLSAAGVDDETAQAIKTDLQAVLESGFSTGNSSPRSVKESVDSVFEKYDLNAEDILGPPGRPEGAGGAEGSDGPQAASGGRGPRSAGGPPPPPQNGQVESGYLQDSTEYDDLLSLVKSLSEKGTDPSQLAQTVLDALYGFDATA